MSQLSQKTEQQVVTALEAPFAAVTLSDTVKQRVDQTIERYSLGKALLELHTLAIPLCLPKPQLDQRPREDAD